MLFRSQSKESKTNSFKEMIVESMVWAGQFNIGDFIPFIAWMDIQGILRQMKRVHKKFDKFLTELIEEHQASADERKGKPDFLDIIMANQEDGPPEDRITLTNIKAVLVVCECTTLEFLF